MFEVLKRRRSLFVAGGAATAPIGGGATIVSIPSGDALAAAADATSAETAEVSVTIDVAVKLTGFQGVTDFQFGAWDPDTDGALTANIDLCVWSNDGSPACARLSGDRDQRGDHQRPPARS